MVIKVVKVGNGWLIEEYQDGMFVRYVILNDDEMKELAKRMKEAGF